MRACQPIAASRLTSISLRGVPSGFVGSVRISPPNPTAAATIPPSSRIETSVPVPTLMWLSIGSVLAA